MRIVTAALCIVLTSPTWAGSIADPIGSLAMSDCNLKMINMNVNFNTLQRQVETNEQAQMAMKQMLKASSNAKTPGKSVGSQMKPTERDAFQEARQHKISIDMLQLIESNYSRDIESLLAMAQVADTRYRWDTVLEEKDPNFVYQAALDLMAIGAPNQDVTTPTPSTTCTTEIALHSIEDESIRRFDALDLHKAGDWIQSMLAKYHFEKIDRSKMSQADQATYDQMWKDYLGPAQKESRFYKDIEYIKLIAKADLINYESSKRDLLDSGGNPAQIGATFKKMVDEKKIDGPLSSAFAVRNLIETKKPSQMMNQLKIMAKEVDRINKENPVTD